MTLLEEKLGDWKPVSRSAGIAWLCFYALFLLYAFADRSGQEKAPGIKEMAEPKHG